MRKPELSIVEVVLHVCIYIHFQVCTVHQFSCGLNAASHVMSYLSCFLTL